MAWGRETYKFEGVEDVLEAIREADADFENVSPPDRGYRVCDIHSVNKVTWIGSKGYVVRIPVKNVLFMEGNMWGFGHAKALLEGILDQSNYILEVPSARVYRVTAERRKESEKYERSGELSYQLGMTEPWTRDEQGEYYAQLLDGNHRAAAAMLAGEPYIYVYVGENTRENVYKKDLE